MVSLVACLLFVFYWDTRWEDRKGVGRNFLSGRINLKLYKCTGWRDLDLFLSGLDELYIKAIQLLVYPFYPKGKSYSCTWLYEGNVILLFVTDFIIPFIFVKNKIKKRTRAWFS